MFSEETVNLAVKPMTTAGIGFTNSMFVEQRNLKSAAVDGALVGGASFVGDVGQQYLAPAQNLVGVGLGAVAYGGIRPMLGKSKGFLAETIKGGTMIGAGAGMVDAVVAGFGAFD